MADDLRRKLEAARERAHNAPMAKIYETHKGEKFIGVHTDAWAKASREYGDLLALSNGANTMKPDRTFTLYQRANGWYAELSGSKYPLGPAVIHSGPWRWRWMARWLSFPVARWRW